jgi:hypothetical protein
MARLPKADRIVTAMATGKPIALVDNLRDDA